MALADDIAAHRGRTLVALGAAHDYFESTKIAWRIVQQHIDGGEVISVRNGTTGTEITHANLSNNTQLYVGYLAISTLQQFVSLFEDFLIGLLRQWLIIHHKEVEKKQVPITIVFEAADLRDAQMRAIDHELNALSYKRLSDWFLFQSKIVKLNCPSDDEIEQLAEIKATRDLFIHNRGVANATYVDKAGKRARFKAGETAYIPEPYHRSSWELICKIVNDMSAAAQAKA